MRHLSWTIAKNAVSNVVRGGAGAIVAFALPHFLAHSLSHDRFAAWSLMLQIAAYASFLDFGLQTAVARFIAQALELEQHDQVRKLIGTAFAMLSIAAALAFLIIGTVLFFSGSFFHGVSPDLLHEFKLSALTLALGAVLMLPLSTFTGVLIGMQQNEFIVLAVGGSRLFGAAAAIVCAHYTQSLTVIALCVTVPNLLGGLLQAAIVWKQLASVRNFRLSVDRAAAIGFLRYCAGLTVWAFGMLLISGLDVTIVGHFQFEAVGYYAIAATLTNLFASANSTVMSAFLAPFAAMQARGDLNQMRAIVIRSTRANTALNVVATGLMVAFGERGLNLWVGSYYAHLGYSILVALMVAQTIRLTFSSFSIALMSTGLQHTTIVASLVEAITNLFASLWGIRHFGPIGVAYGSVIGALVSLPAIFTFSVKFQKDLPIRRLDLGINGIGKGILIGMPALLCSLYGIWKHPGPWASLLLWIVSLGLTSIMFLARNNHTKYHSGSTIDASAET